MLCFDSIEESRTPNAANEEGINQVNMQGNWLCPHSRQMYSTDRHHAVLVTHGYLDTCVTT